jgi:DNA replication protein DnaC
VLDGHRSILSIALGVQAARRGYRVAFATAHEWVGRLGAAKRAGRLDEELERLRRIPLVVVDEVEYIPFDPEAAALFFALISSRYERASLIVSSNKTFSAWRRSSVIQWPWPPWSTGSCTTQR